MCCWTHEYRDRADTGRGIKFTLAESADSRCQCKFGNQCQRRMTQEDLLCDWCRGRGDEGHYTACNDLMRLPFKEGERGWDYFIDIESFRFEIKPKPNPFL